MSASMSAEELRTWLRDLRDLVEGCWDESAKAAETDEFDGGHTDILQRIEDLERELDIREAEAAMAAKSPSQVEAALSMRPNVIPNPSGSAGFVSTPDPTGDRR